MIDEELADHDKQGHVANKLRLILTARLEKLRAQNDTCPMEKTERLRGRIHEVKNLLNGLQLKPSFEIESDDT